MVITPVSDDLTNEGGGGPVLLSVPPGSLTNLVTYGNRLKDARVSYVGCVTELSFTQDPSIAFPKIEFNYVRPLSDEEVIVILGLREHEQVGRILATKMQTEELAEDGEAAQPRAAARPVARAAATSRPSAVQPPAAPPVSPAAQAPPPPPPPPVANTAPVQRMQAAPPPPPPAATPPRVGGFALQPVRTPEPTTVHDPASINSAMSRPAQRPTTLRAVAPTPPPAPEPIPAPQEYDGPADGGEPDATEGYMPDEMAQLFSGIMGTK
jgi:hypothetical protein